MSDPTYYWYWHVHPDTLCEALHEPLDDRIGYIQEAYKPASEIETWLRLFRPCGPGVALAWAEYERVKDAAQAELERARDALVRALDEYEHVTNGDGEAEVTG